MITFRKLGKHGRFGNQLFQYAGSRLYAELNGFDWAFPPWIGDHIFSLPRSLLKPHHFFLPTIQLEDMKSTSWPERLLHPLGLWRRSSMSKLYAHPKDMINIYGHLQDETSINKLREHRDLIRSWFIWKPEIESTFRAATRGISWVGLHIRHGDYVGAGCAIPVQIYLDALSHIRGNHPVYLATDDPTVQYELDPNILLNVPNPLPDLYACTPGDLFDFWMLQHATVVIGGGSTFSWWAAFLGTNRKYYAPPLTHLWIGHHKTPPPIIHKKF